jgi:hypothetical protein
MGTPEKGKETIKTDLFDRNRGQIESYPLSARNISLSPGFGERKTILLLTK